MKYAGGALLPTRRVDRESGRPIAVQLVGAIRELVPLGVLASGQRLPAHPDRAARQLPIDGAEIPAAGAIPSGPSLP